jgi:dihydroorotate dehydrogenase
MLYRAIVRRVLFTMDPEDAHERTMRLLGAASAALDAAAPLVAIDDKRLATTVAGLRFPSPVGLAAGLDKHAEAVAAWPALGAGFVEVGTVTPRPQPGNPRPRVFRLKPDRALVNRMGFNSIGAEAVARRLEGIGRRRAPVGVNVGKNRDTPNDAASADYTRAIAALAPFADYFVVNVSSPNTAGLRDLQRPASIQEIVAAARAAAVHGGRPRPVFVKVSPDLAGDELDATVDAVVAAGADGIVATNTTLARDGLASPLASEGGGLSGAPLRERALDACRRIYRRTEGRVPIVGVGGIFTAEDAYERMRAGASLVQVYTALVYEGPLLFRRLARGLARLAARDGLSQLSDAVGADVQP